MSVYTPIQATVYGRVENRLKSNTVLHLPLKAGNTVDTVDTTPQVFVVGTTLTWYVAGNYYTPSGKPAILGNDYFTL
jgi:3D (Asp-Asp-Asp) domain-containing protein